MRVHHYIFCGYISLCVQKEFRFDGISYLLCNWYNSTQLTNRTTKQHAWFESLFNWFRR